MVIDARATIYILKIPSIAVPQSALDKFYGFTPLFIAPTFAPTNLLYYYPFYYSHDPVNF